MAKARKARMVRVALVKAESRWGDVKTNVRLLETLAGPLAGAGIDVLVTPECFLDGYMVRERKTCTPEMLAKRSVTGPKHPVMKRVAALAERLGSYLVCGASEKGADGAIRNAAYLFGRRGEHVGTYYKTFPSEFYASGQALPVFATDFATVGIVICADRRWPENIRCLRLDGAEIILNPTWGGWGEQNTAIMRTRAYENGIPVCFAHPRQSLVCHADGAIGAVLESNRPGVLVHDVDLCKNEKEARKSRNVAGSHPVQHRRPELYGPIVRRGEAGGAGRT